MKTSIRFTELSAALPEETADLLVRVARTSVRRGTTIRIVGGPVRDLLLGRSLSDLDLMVESNAEALAEAVRAGRGGSDLKFVRHDRFGTVRIESEKAHLDLASMRSETYARAGALPDVAPGSFEEDMRRRDFSVNALGCILDVENPDAPQPVDDTVGGLADLERKRLRVLHSGSFHDDPTRAFRAARFAARLGFSLDRKSRGALHSALRDGAFGGVSGERFRRELQFIFEEARQGVQVGRVLRLLSDWHVLAGLEPGLSLTREGMGPLRRLSKTLAEPDWTAPRWRAWQTGLALWLAPLPAAQRRRTLERFSVRGEQASRIVRFGREGDRILKSLARARGRGAVDAILGELPEETIQALYASAAVAVRRRILRWGAEDRRRRSPLSGNELLELGLQGPDVGTALRRIRAGFLDGEVANREEAIALAEEIARRAARRKPPKKATSKRRKVARAGSIADTPSVGSREETREESGPKRPNSPKSKP